MSDKMEFSAKREVLDKPAPVSHANTFENTAYTESIDKVTLPEVPGMHYRSADIYDFLDIFHLCIKGYQSYFVKVSPEIDDSLLYFPFAWYLEVGSRIFNKTTGAEYKISSSEETIGENVIRISKGPDALWPENEDILLLDFDNFRSLNFQHSYPNSDDIHRYVTEEEIAKNSEGEFIDTISHRVSKIEPANIQGVKHHGAMRRESQVDLESGAIESVSTEIFDNTVTLQCWTKTNAQTSRLSRWLRAFMTRYRAVFKVNGVQELIFIRQGSEYNVTRWRNDIVGTTLVYQVRTQERFKTLGSQMKGFRATLNVLAGNEELLETQDNIE